MAAERLLMTSICLCALEALFLLSLKSWIQNLHLTIIISGVSVFWMVLALILVFTSLNRVSPHLSLSATLYLVFSNLKARHDGLRALKMFRHNCKDVVAAQEKLLKEIIYKNSATDYGHEFGLCTIRSLDDLRTRHPLTTYDHYARFIDRVAQGGQLVMTRDPPTRFCRTSGTTGKFKLIPQDNKKLLPKIRAVIKGVTHENFPELTVLQRIMKLHIHRDFKRSKCGIPIAAVTAIDPKMMKYLASYTTPPEGLLLKSLFDVLYVHLLFGLREKSLGVIEASFITTFEEAIRILMTKWKNLVEGLKTGTIFEGVHLEPQVRSALSKALGTGDVTRAHEVEVEIRKGPTGIVKRLWPNIAFIGCIDNLGRKPYLQTNIAAGVPIYSYGYGSSEGAQGVNLWPSEDFTQFVPFLDVAIFEFIPEEAMRAMLLNIHGEKVSQPTVAASLKEALHLFPGITLEQYCVVESPQMPQVADAKGKDATILHYVFFLELKVDEGRDLDKVDVKVLAKMIDDEIRRRHTYFRRDRELNKLASTEVYLVNNNAFRELRNYILSSGEVSAVQFKLPLKLRTPEMVEVMLANIL